MQNLIITITLFICSLTFGQDYFTIVKKNDNVSYNYPKNVVMMLIGPDGQQLTLSNEANIDVTGDYKVAVYVPWRDTPEIIDAEGGQLEIFKLPAEELKARAYTEEKSGTTSSEKYRHHSNKPKVEQRTITPSESKPGRYNLLVTFTNALTFKYEDGVARAWQNGDELEVKNKYLVQTPEGLLKLSFDPSDGETWWFFDI
ncbi:MAG: hypothetical protein WBG71_14100 [Leeuwenhoekiella sp.]